MFPLAPWSDVPLTGAGFTVLILMVVYLVGVEPRLGDRYFGVLRRAGTDPRRRERWFAGLVAMQVAALVVTVALILGLPGVTLDNTGLVWGTEISGTLLGILVGGLIGIAAAVAGSWRSAGGSNPAAERSPALHGDLHLFLPRSPRERGWLAGVALGAGTSEELLYRGLLPALLVAAGLPVVGAIAAQALLFGLAHRYQGRSGMITTGLLGLFFGWLTAHTGSLLLPILLHVAVDLKLAVMPGPGAAPP